MIAPTQPVPALVEDRHAVATPIQASVRPKRRDPERSGGGGFGGGVDEGLLLVRDLGRIEAESPRDGGEDVRVGHVGALLPIGLVQGER